MSHDHKTLAVTDEGGVLRVRLDRPDQGNALDETMLSELGTILVGLRERPDIRVLVLSGAGDDFCLGGGRAEMAELLAADPTGLALRRLGDRARAVCEALAAAEVVTIARVHGRTIGAGVALALHCDLRVGTEDSRFRLPELALGLPTTWGGALARLISELGMSRVRELVLTADALDAQTAHRIGMLHRVAPSTDIDRVVDGWIRPTLRRSASALRTSKALLHAYSAPSRLADVGLLDSHLLAVAVGEATGG
ncbi:enoyl-CoA hydratase/isomerase family protein [Embleya sp. NPDC001921]